MGIRPRQMADRAEQFKNLLTNPGLDVWQRGAGPFNCAPSAVFGPDEYECQMASGSATVSRNSSPKVGAFCAELNIASGADAYLQQGIEHWKSLEGKWLTLSAWVKSDATDSVEVQIYYTDSGAGAAAVSARNVEPNEWERLTCVLQIGTGLVPSASIPHSSAIGISLRRVGTGVCYFDGATLVEGNFPEGVPFAPFSAAEDLERCQRYYEACEKSHLSGECGTSHPHSKHVFFNTQKAAVPTMTFNTISSSNANTALMGGRINPEGMCFEMRSLAGVPALAYHRFDWSAEVT